MFLSSVSLEDVIAKRVIGTSGLRSAEIDEDQAERATA